MIQFANERAVAEQMMEAINSGDEERISTAWENFHNSIADQIRRDFEEVKATNDASILAQRGYRQLISKETNFYSKVISALRSQTPKQAFATILGTDEEGDLMPETVIEDVYKDLVEEHPILNAVNFQYVRYLTKWVLNDHSTQKAVWGEITDTIIKEISSSFKVISVNQSKLSAYAVIERGKANLNISTDKAFTDLTDCEIGAGTVKFGNVRISCGSVAASSMSGAATKSISFSGFASAPIVVVSPYCTATAASGYALSAYVMSISTTSASVRVSSNYTSSLSVGLRWIAIGVAA